jgi:hypothetical protein
LELRSAEQMKMEVGNRLSGVWTVIGDDPVAAVMQAVLGGDARRQCQRVRRDDPIVATDFAQGCEVSSRHDEHVDRRLRVEVAEGDVMLALRNELSPELAARDTAEDAICNGWARHHFMHSKRFCDEVVVRSGSLQPSSLKRATVMRVCQNSPRSKLSVAP